MNAIDPDTLLDNPGLVHAVAPWCVRLDGLELAILLLGQPWLAGGGLRRADIEHRLARIGAEVPIGPVYFQRINRAVARLDAIGALQVAGSGRTRRFRLSPQGFAALVLNLRVLGVDPTVDGSEFELKRALVAVSNVVLERFADLPGEVPAAPAVDAFFAEVERIEIWGRRVVTHELLQTCFDVLALVELQHARVTRMLQGVERRLEEAGRTRGLLEGVDGARLAEAVATSAADPRGNLAVAATLRELATGALRELNLRAAALRYHRYLQYLDDLAGMYAVELRVVEAGMLRRLTGPRAG